MLSAKGVFPCDQHAVGEPAFHFGRGACGIGIGMRLVVLLERVVHTCLRGIFHLADSQPHAIARCQVPFGSQFHRTFSLGHVVHPSGAGFGSCLLACRSTLCMATHHNGICHRHAVGEHGLLSLLDLTAPLPAVLAAEVEPQSVAAVFLPAESTLNGGRE